MSDWNVYVDNDEVSVYDTSNHATLEEIRDLLKLILERLPPTNENSPVKGS